MKHTHKSKYTRISIGVKFTTSLHSTCTSWVWYTLRQLFGPHIRLYYCSWWSWTAKARTLNCYPYFHMDNRLILVWNRLNLRDSLLHTTTFRTEWSTQNWDQKLPVGHWRIHSFPFLILVWQLNRRRVVLNIPRRDSWCYPKTLSWGCKKLYPEQQKGNKTIEICCT